MHDTAGTITAVASAGVVLGGLGAWILSNERRISALERSYEAALATTLRVDAAIEALHERLDAHFTGRERRSPQEKA